ncbi:hypothetical protein [Nocardia arthritidis]|uniref:Uncharacterized protein n=1 Tax=Nocardia arthritidis TaxID=228602 RepID=A0A6G9YDL4_9NOCA|nr:hypothetical protein [Nocardia arthritidis]QIS11167.1 hypothetical protein F5544_16440 [Nocardia arthritidis]
MTELQVDLDHLRAAAKAWRDASRALGEGAELAQKLKDEHRDVNWSVFESIWHAHIIAAKYMNERLTEGKNEAYSIGSVLLHVANVYHEKDKRFANTLIKLEGV